jgi:hypothetical protein
MARITNNEEVEFKIKMGTYPWLRWLNGSIWAPPGQDFTCTVPAFRAHAYATARHYGIRVTTCHRDGLFYLQANPAASDWQPGQ